MNDNDAMDAINAVLEEWLVGDIDKLRALSHISNIATTNFIERIKVMDAQS